MFDRYLALLIYILAATVIIAQIAIKFGPTAVFWLGLWGVSVLAAFGIGAAIGLKRGRDEYKPWR
ncbi:MAG: hypothetical protein ACP5LD_10530 [Desulfomonilaceae bacterium]